MPNPVVHFEVTGPDAPKLQRFYADLFDWKIDADNEWRYGLVETGGEGGIGGGIGAEMGGGSRVSVYAAVDDLQRYLDRAVELGGKALMGPDDVGGVTIALFADPAGNVTGLIKSGDESAG